MKTLSLTFLFSLVTVLCHAQQTEATTAPKYDADGKVMDIHILKMNISGLRSQQNIDELHEQLRATASFNITMLNTTLATGQSEIQYYDSPGTKQAIIKVIEKNGYTVEDQ